MFQLIVAVISIALVAALAIASIYYGGAAFTKSSLKANVTTLVNGGQQISGAQALYKTDFSGATAPTTVALTPGYLSAAPGTSGAAAENATWTIGVDTDNKKIAYVAVNVAAKDEVCFEAEKQAGLESGDNATPYVSRGTLDPAQQFGCVDVSGATVFAFKF